MEATSARETIVKERTELPVAANQSQYKKRGLICQEK
jgi:hypothetical protein